MMNKKCATLSDCVWGFYTKIEDVYDTPTVVDTCTVCDQQRRTLEHTTYAVGYISLTMRSTTRRELAEWWRIMLEGDYLRNWVDRNPWAGFDMGNDGVRI